MPSATGKKIHLLSTEKILKNCDGTETFAKIVFDEKYYPRRNFSMCTLGKEFGIELILQPKMGIDNKMSVSSEFWNQILDKLTDIYPNVRLIPQVPNSIDVR